MLDATDLISKPAYVDFMAIPAYPSPLRDVGPRQFRGRVSGPDSSHALRLKLDPLHLGPAGILGEVFLAALATNASEAPTGRFFVHNR